MRSQRPRRRVPAGTSSGPYAPAAPCRAHSGSAPSRRRRSLPDTAHRSGMNGGAAMVQTRYAPDRGLQARMGLTMFLLGLVFVALVVALIFILQAFGVGNGAIIFL